MNCIRSPLFWFFAGAFGMAAAGLIIALRLTGWSPPIQSANLPIHPVIHVRNPVDVETTRQALTEFIFASQTLPSTTAQPEKDGMLVRLPNGFASFITIYPSEQSNRTLILYHTGHEGFTARDRAAIQTYLRAGYTVWRLDMPLMGANPTEIKTEIPEAGEVVIRQHRQMAYLKSTTEGHPVRFFIEPVIAAVNTGRDMGYASIFATGLSGGGWTILLAAALDPRIEASYPVAGGLPLSLRFDQPKRHWGDWEENLPELHAIASFEDLIILGSAGRSQIHVLNEYDICCYNDARFLDFVPAIQAVVEPMGGHFEIHWSKGEFLHRANPTALQIILADMSSRQMP